MTDPTASSDNAARRPLASRNTNWARSASAALIRLGLTPNQISLLSIVFAVIAGVAIAWTAELEGAMRVIALMIAAASIQARLVCNLLDGLMAVEGGLKSPVGDIYNDLPDRIADAVIFIGAGCAARHLEYGLTLGWLAAVMAIFTAYVRVLGAASGVPHDFRGPMAKQHRMAVMTFACIAATFEPLRDLEGQTLRAALAIIVAGCVVTVIRRSFRTAALLRARHGGAG